MRIQHNIAALNTSRLGNIIGEKKSKSMEKLSSGYRINRAADDAAGLAISEKMTAQIRGLNKASENVENGVLLVQTADGAIQEINDILIRIRTLSVQSINDTNTDIDRENLQDEVEQLLEEIDRIGFNTEFNTLPILQGDAAVIQEGDVGIVSNQKLVSVSEADSFDDEEVFDPTKIGITEALTIKSNKTIDFSMVTNQNKQLLSGAEFTFGCVQNCSQQFSFKFVNSISHSENQYKEIGEKYGIHDLKSDTATSSGGSKEFEIALDCFSSGRELVNNLSNYIQEMNGIDGYRDPYTKYNVGHANFLFGDGSKLVIAGDTDASGVNHRGYELFTSTNLANIFLAPEVIDSGLVIQAGANEGQVILLDLPQIDLETMKLSDLDISTREGASSAIGLIDKAINYVNKERSRMGAYQNRLDHARSNIDVSAENLTESLSRIEDTDMAEEMVTYTQQKVLSEAATSMLAQANARPENILSLLKA